MGNKIDSQKRLAEQDKKPEWLKKLLRKIK